MVYDALTLFDARLANGALADLTVADGTIVSVVSAGGDGASAREAASGVSGAARARAMSIDSPAFDDVVRGRADLPAHLDLQGRLVLPALVNGHAHLDKTFMGAPWQPHRVGTTVPARVGAERDIRSTISESVGDRSAALARAMVESGTGTVRTHVDIDTELGLSSLESLLELRDALRGVLRMQIVAFPQSGILASPGVERLLEEALIAGADVIGGLDPAGFDRDAARHLDIVFELAGAYGVGVDIHLHELGGSAVEQYHLIAERTRRVGLAGRVVVSHAYGLGSIELDLARRIGHEFGEAGVAVMTNGPAGPMPPVLAMRAAGATVFSGSDNIRDAWWPYGDGDMLGIARQVAYQSNFRTDEELEIALDLVTHAAASAIGLDRYGVVAGAPADLLVLDAPSPAAAVAGGSGDRIVLHGGAFVAAQTRETHLAAPALRGAVPVRP